MYDPRRQHPIAVVQAFSHYILLLLFPLMRSLVLLQGDIPIWVQGVWKDVVALLSIIFFGWLRWRRDIWQLADDSLVIRKGLLFRKVSRIPVDCIASAVIETPFWLRPFRAVRLRLETDAGSRKDPDVRLLLRRTDADELTAAVGDCLWPGTLQRCYTPNSRSVAFLSLLTSDSLTGVLFVSALISQAGRLLGKEAEEQLITGLTRLMQLVAFGLPPLAAVIAVTLLGGWLLDFFRKLVRHLGFTAVRDGDMLKVRAGVFVVREYRLPVDMIHFLQLRQSLLTRLLGYCSVMISCTGYGKEKGELSALFPAADRQETRRGLKLILPEIHPSYGGCHPEKQVLSRFLIPPLSLLAALSAILWLCYQLLPDMRELTFFLGLMAVLPAIWWLFVKIAAFHFVGLDVRDGICTFRSVWGFAFFTTSVRRDRIALAELRQSLLQRQKHCCDVVIRLRSEKGRRIVVQNVPMIFAENFLREFYGNS